MKELCLILLFSAAVFSGVYIVVNQPSTDDIVLSFKIGSFKEQLTRDKIIEFTVLPTEISSQDSTPLAEKGETVYATIKPDEHNFAMVTGLYKTKEDIPEMSCVLPCTYRGVMKTLSDISYHKIQLPFEKFELRDKVTAKGRRIIEKKMNLTEKVACLIVSMEQKTGHYQVRDLIINNQSIPKTADQNGYFIHQQKEGNYTTDSIHFSLKDDHQNTQSTQNPEPEPAPAPRKKSKQGLLSVIE